MKRKLMFGAFALVAAGLAMSIAAPRSSVSMYGARGTQRINNKWYPDFANQNEEKDYARQVNIELAEESAILLKNNDNALPLARGSKVSLLGNCSYNWVAGGAGSGSSDPVEVKLEDGLENVGIELNGMAKDFYSKHRTTATISGGMGSATQDVQEDPATLAPIEPSLRYYKDVIWTISRTGGEGADLRTHGVPTNKDQSKHYLEFNDNELKMLDYLTELKAAGKIGKVVLLINAANVIEMGPAMESDTIDAILWGGQPGTNGLQGVANVLVGKVAPSGRTVDIWTKDHRKDPTWQNFGDNNQHALGETGEVDNNSDHGTNVAYNKTENEGGETVVVAARGTNVVEYEEGIYVGYKYYETADAEAKAGNYEGFVYEDVVAYPFGFGLSYTSFEQKVVTPKAEIEAAINNATGIDDRIYVDVEVKNVGKVVGKDVVQLYNHAPYTKGGIEKAEVALAGFAKSSTLKPGQSEIVSVEIRIGDLASFDYNDANKNDYNGFELEAGKYELRLQKNSHELIEAIELDLAAKTTELDTDNNAENNNLLSKGDDFDSLLNMKAKGSESTMKLMSRADMKGTFPTNPTKAERVYGETLTSLMTNSKANNPGSNTNEQRYTGVTNSDDDKESDPWYKTNDDIPAGWTQAKDTQGRTDGRTAVLLREMEGINYWDTESVVPEGHAYAGMTHAEAWEKFMNQLTLDEMKSLLTNGSYQTPGLDSVGKEKGTDQDGPAKLKQNGYNFVSETNIASTWNVQLAYERGRITGNDSLFMNTPGWYAPAMNTHRSPFSGRNFEYYSEDGVLAGRIGSMDVKGYQDKGGYAFIKHFTLNDCETNRTGLSTFASEQAAREIYMKSFEYAVKDGGAKAVMSSFNRVGAIPASGHYITINGILRNEWGFHGEIVTDYYSGGGAMAQGNMALRAGAEMPLGRNNWSPITGTWDESLREGKGGVRDGAEVEGVVPEAPTQWYAIRIGALHVLWVGANSNNNQNGLEKSAFANQTIKVVQGLSFTKAIEVDEELLGSDYNTFAFLQQQGRNLVEVDKEEVLPKGIRFDEGSGTFSGTPAEAGTYKFDVRMISDAWVHTDRKVTLEVVPAIETEKQEDGSIKVSISDAIEVGEPVTQDDPIGTSRITAATIRQVKGLPEGLSYADGVISGESEVKDYKFTVQLRITTSTVSQSWGGIRVNNKNTDINVTITIGNPVEPAKQVSEFSINEDGDLVVTYTDKTSKVLGHVVGEAGESGARGREGFDGKDGEDGVGIADVTASKEGGVTVVTFTLSNGEEVTFSVADGAQGEKGETGEKGNDGAPGKDGANGEAAKGGCGGSIVATSAIITTAAVGLLGLAIAKKRKENK